MEEINKQIGREVEGYKIIKAIGKGKFSIVYKAKKKDKNVLVALKIIKVFLSKNLDL